jgi:hypothetical protein
MSMPDVRTGRHLVTGTKMAAEVECAKLRNSLLDIGRGRPDGAKEGAQEAPETSAIETTRR